MIDPLSYSTQTIYTIRIADWTCDAANLSLIRRSVFIDEQQVPEELEWDEWDSKCLHVIAMSNSNEPIGTARMLSNGYVGRMAVIKQWRRKGVGSALLLKILSEMEKCNLNCATLNAQVAARKFYERFGFRKTGEEFMEAGIPHVKMILKLR